MFRLEESREFDWPVSVALPDGATEDGSPRRTEARFVARFRAVSLDELRGRQADALLMDDVLLSWRDVLDADDTPLAVTPENKRRLLVDPAVLAALAAAYTDALFGGRARKN